MVTSGSKLLILSGSFLNIYDMTRKHHSTQRIKSFQGNNATSIAYSPVDDTIIVADALTLSKHRVSDSGVYTELIWTNREIHSQLDNTAMAVDSTGFIFFYGSYGRTAYRGYMLGYQTGTLRQEHHVLSSKGKL